MSGHSKWSKVKHQKAVTDAVKSAAFTRISRAITIAVREGGGITDPSGNFKLRLAIDSARGVNMPKDTIERAIERARVSGEHLEEFLYEGYGPGGVAILARGVTDNKQRTAAHVKHLFDRYGGSLAGQGSVGYLFSKVGAISVAQPQSDQLFELAVRVGAIELEDEEGKCVIYTLDTMLHEVSQKLVSEGVPIASQNIIFRPRERFEVEPHVAERALQLLNELARLDDVSDVYTNI